MPALTLPSTFSNSFWTQDYRRGIETLFNKLEQGVIENDELVAFIRARALAENNIADALVASQETGRKGKGFDADEGASLLMAFRGLQAEAVAQGNSHRTIAEELNDLVARPFEEWAAGHRDRIYGSRNSIIDGWAKSYELAQGDVEKMKHQYLAKVRRADEAEDDAKFAPNKDIADNYTTSPRLPPRDQRNPQRTASVSERIAQRFKEIQNKAMNGSQSDAKVESAAGVVVFDDKSVISEPENHPVPSTKENDSPHPIDKGKGKEKSMVDEPQALLSPPPMTLDLPSKSASDASSPVPVHPPPPILLAGLALPPAAVSNLLERAAADMNLRPIKFPIIGEYKDCFSGEDFVVWLADHVQGLGSSIDRAEDAAKDLCEREGVLRRVGEFGNAFENNDEAYYQFRPKAFNLVTEYTKHGQSDSLSSPISNLSPLADNLVKRSNTFVSRVSKAIGERNNEPPHIRARAEANAADAAYRAGVRKLDRQRLALEEKLEETLKFLQKWEHDRLRAVKTVLLQYQGTLVNLPSGLQSSFDRSSTLVASYQPEADLRALIEQYRTGPFKPTAHVYESLTHEEADVYFGIDLRRWAEGGWNNLRSGEPPIDKIPEVLTALLGALDNAYPKLSNDDEKRKAWIYEVPLSSSHHLRENLNAVAPGKSFPSELISKYDAPVIASTVKLWMLELDPPLATWEGWDDFRRIYPSMGAGAAETDDQQRIQDLQTALLKLPRVHILVLDAVLKHLNSVIANTKSEEDNEVYITKLALSLGRTVLRPKVENEITIQDRHPMLLFMDILTHYEAIIPPTLARKKRESDRKIPLRKRTAPIDMRVSRSRLSVANIDTREILEEQMVKRNPSMRPHSRSPSTVGSADKSSRLVSTSSPSEATASALTAKDVIPEPAPSKTSGSGFDGPPMPTFKEPPPEVDDAIASPPMPTFKEPPPEADDTNDTETPNTPMPVTVAPPTLERSRSDSPASSAIDKSNTASEVRLGSGETRLRGPRGARLTGARPQSTAGTPSVTSPSTATGGGTVGTRNRATSPGGGLHRSNRLSLHGRNSPVNPADYAGKKGHRTQASAFANPAHSKNISKEDGE